ncbi:hypothetical protein [Aeromonas rivipollensis]|uniref:Uncharacterized protein n=1 Tax=Aeromonas rivipollensis TaxID=948519 RepID=A0AAW9YIE7_9GAMM|nr:hypothetical protein [Aeromonas rivipollensis]NEX77229.1 hypothetical protein [Aeromonas rivipollensis]
MSFIDVISQAIRETLNKGFVKIQKANIDVNAGAGVEGEQPVELATKEFFQNELAVNDSKPDVQVFARHRDALMGCIERYKNDFLEQQKAIALKEASDIFDQIGSFEEIDNPAPSANLTGVDTYRQGLKAIVLAYCEKHRISKSSCICEIPQELCDGKRVIRDTQKFSSTSKSRWKNFDDEVFRRLGKGTSHYVMFDTSMFGNGKVGFGLGPSGIISLGGSPNEFYTPWSRVTELSTSKGHLYVNDDQTDIASSQGYTLLELIVEKFNKAMKSDGVALLNYLGYTSEVQAQINKHPLTNVEDYLKPKQNPNQQCGA